MGSDTSILQIENRVTAPGTSSQRVTLPAASGFKPSWRAVRRKCAAPGHQPDSCAGHLTWTGRAFLVCLHCSPRSGQYALDGSAAVTTSSLVREAGGPDT